MMSFRGGRLRDLSIPAGTVWLMTDIAVECLGRGPGAPWRRKGHVFERGQERG